MVNQVMYHPCPTGLMTWLLTITAACGQNIGRVIIIWIYDQQGIATATIPRFQVRYRTLSIK